jgi:hypothetical protein
MLLKDPQEVAPAPKEAEIGRAAQKYETLIYPDPGNSSFQVKTDNLSFSSNRFFPSFIFSIFVEKKNLLAEKSKA